MSIDDLFKCPKRDDEAAAKRWRGPLFENMMPVEPRIEVPPSVTFPICFCCQHIIWDWPYFAEAVTMAHLCEACSAEDDANDPWDGDWNTLK